VTEPKKPVTAADHREEAQIWLDLAEMAENMPIWRADLLAEAKKSLRAAEAMEAAEAKARKTKVAP
jgi:hypothetical protein